MHCNFSCSNLMLYYTTYLHCITKCGAYLLYRSRVAIWWWLNFITGLCTLTQLPWLVRSLPHQRTKPSCNFVCSLITNETVWRWGMQCIRMISLFWLCFFVDQQLQDPVKHLYQMGHHILLLLWLLSGLDKHCHQNGHHIYLLL